MNYEIFQMTDEKEERLWKESIFVFDSSVLLDFYFFPKSTRDEIFTTLFIDKMKNRLWIPSQVQFEYLKNRESVIRKPIVENYKPLKNNFLKNIQNSIVQIDKDLSELEDRTKKDDRHPHLEQSKFKKFSKTFDKFKTQSKKFEDSLNKQIKEREDEINNLSTDDDVLKTINDNFKIGRDFSYNEIIEITKEGKQRYEFSIPPGYQDLKSKVGIQIFGDLIIWKQILEYSKETKKPIVFICNDLKTDWCYLEKEKRNRIKSPREELIKEIYDYSQIEFWMYDLPQFLYKSNKYIDGNIEKLDISSFIKLFETRDLSYIQRNKRDIVPDIYTCGMCDGKDGFGNIVSFWNSCPLINEYPKSHPHSKYDSTNMGNCEWCNTLHIKCPKCGSVTTLSDHQFDEKIECEGGCGNIFYVDTSKDYDHIGDYDVILKDHRIEKCVKCGNDFTEDESLSDCCSKCEKEYNDD